MRIGLISDTHIPEAGCELPPQVYQALAGVELILHAGDMHVIEVLDWLEEIAPVLGARGNGDGDGHRPDFPDDDPRVKEAHVFDAEGVTVGLTHGFPLPEEAPWTTLQDLMVRKLGGPVDVIVCGDTHVTMNCLREGVLYVNPGSPTLPRQMYALGQVAILTVEEGRASAEIIELASVGE